MKNRRLRLVLVLVCLLMICITVTSCADNDTGSRIFPPIFLEGVYTPDQYEKYCEIARSELPDDFVYLSALDIFQAELDFFHPMQGNTDYSYYFKADRNGCRMVLKISHRKETEESSYTQLSSLPEEMDSMREYTGGLSGNVEYNRDGLIYRYYEGKLYSLVWEIDQVRFKLVDRFDDLYEYPEGGEKTVIDRLLSISEDEAMRAFAEVKTHIQNNNLSPVVLERYRGAAIVVGIVAAVSVADVGVYLLIRFHRKRMPMLAACGVLLALSGVVIFWIADWKPVVADAEKIQEGMTYAQVADILGQTDGAIWRENPYVFVWEVKDGEGQSLSVRFEKTDPNASGHKSLRVVSVGLPYLSEGVYNTDPPILDDAPISNREKLQIIGIDVTLGVTAVGLYYVIRFFNKRLLKETIEQETGSELETTPEE